MAEISNELRRALESDCAQDMCAIVDKRDDKDFEQLRALISTDPSIPRDQRRKAIYAVGRWGDTKVVADINRVIDDLDAMGLVTAIDALGRLGTPAARDKIIQFGDHPSPEVRKFVIRALGRLRGRTVQAKLRQMQESDPLPYLRNIARAYVGRSANAG
jgi:HEAT repeat protein